MIRKSLVVIAAAAVLSTSFAVSAEAATTRARRAAVHSPSKARPVAARQPRAGSEAAQTDALNQQSLTNARGGAR